MYLYGEFINKKGSVIRVEITSGSSLSNNLEIDDGDSGIYFTAENPVEINCEIKDTFDTLVTHSATIRLESEIELTELYCSNCMETRVRIYRDGECLFAGFIEPQAYSQPFNGFTDEVEINCIDALSALQYLRFAGIGNSESYEQEKARAKEESFRSLIESILSSVAPGYALYYDMSRSMLKDADPSYIFDRISIPGRLFLGDDEDTVWTMQEVLKELLQFLNLHIEQEGDNFYIYSWETAKRGNRTGWRLLTEIPGTPPWGLGEMRPITTDIASDLGTTIGVGETYNVIALTCQTKEAEYLVESPLWEGSVFSPYSKRQKYVTCISVPGNISSKPIETFRKFSSAVDSEDYEGIYTEDGSIKE